MVRNDEDAWFDNYGPVAPEYGSPFATHRGYAQEANPQQSSLSPDLLRGKIAKQELIHLLQKIPADVQRRIRENINFGKPVEQQISYMHIKPTSPDFNPKKVKAILRYHLSTAYLTALSKKQEEEFEDPETLQEVSMLSKTKLYRQFAAIPLKVKKEIMHSFGLNPHKATDYSLDNKRKVVASYETLY